MMLKDVNGEIIFSAQIGGLAVVPAAHTPLIYVRPIPNFSGFALVATCDKFDSEAGSYYEERRVVAWFSREERAQKALSDLLAGFLLTVPSVVGGAA